MNRDVVCVNGARHDLWWEFSLAASFRWQAHIHQLREGDWQRRMAGLAVALLPPTWSGACASQKD